MPDDLGDRIRDSVAKEQAARGSDEGDGFWSDMDDSNRGPRRHRPAGRWALGIGAAVVALGVAGTFALGSGDSDESGGSGTTTAEDDGSGSGETDTGSSESSSSSTGDPSVVPAFAITDTGTDYTRANLAQKAAELEDDPASAPDLKDTGRLDGMTTAAAASDCLARLGQPELLPVVIDVATFDGQEGLLLMAEEAPQGQVHAWAVTTGCEPIWDKAFPISEE